MEISAFPFEPPAKIRVPNPLSHIKISSACNRCHLSVLKRPMGRFGSQWHPWLISKICHIEYLSALLYIPLLFCLNLKLQGYSKPTEDAKRADVICHFKEGKRKEGFFFSIEFFQGFLSQLLQEQIETNFLTTKRISWRRGLYTQKDQLMKISMHDYCN